MKKLLFLFTSAIILGACSKDDPDAGKLMINATAYIGDMKGLYDIVFYPVMRDDKVQNMFDINNPTWVDELFNTFSGKKAMSVEQYKEYMPRGKYHLLIRVASDPLGKLKGSYTYRLIDITESPSMDNIMEFTRGASNNRYQPWKNKYPD